jgi:thioredoxin reductase
VDRPAAQYPYVDPTRCIGCGACVAACPEGDVLGVVGGTATIINGLRCVGHGRCEEACPVSAIEVGLGDVKARADMPQVDEWNETGTPGLFLAGEVRGLALVRNAIEQGRRVVERIAQRGDGPSGADAVQVLIVGAGPAGLSAALACAERGLTHLVLEQEGDLGGSLLHYPRRKMVLLQPVDLPLHGRLAREEYQKEQFLELMEELVASHELPVRFGQKVRGVAATRDGFEVRTDAHAYRARNVVLAVGRRGTPRKLGVPGEDLPKVMYRLIDAESYRGRKLLVVGGGDSAVEAAVGLARQPGNEVTLPLFGSQVLEIAPGSVRLKAGPDAVEIGNDFVFVFAGGDPPFELLKQCGVRFGAPAEPGPVVEHSAG